MVAPGLAYVAHHRRYFLIAEILCERRHAVRSGIARSAGRKPAVDDDADGVDGITHEDGLIVHERRINARHPLAAALVAIGAMLCIELRPLAREVFALR